MKWLKWASGVAVVAVATGLVMWGSDLGGGTARAQSPNPSADVEALISQKTGFSLDTIHKMEAAALAAAADKGTKAGFVAPAQANAIRNVVPGPVLDDLLQNAAPLVGTTPADLFNSLANGMSLGQVAQAHNVAPTTLKSGVAALIQTELGKLQATGVVTPAESSMLDAMLSTNLDKVINEVPAHEKTAAPGTH